MTSTQFIKVSYYITDVDNYQDYVVTEIQANNTTRSQTNEDDSQRSTKTYPAA